MKDAYEELCALYQRQGLNAEEIAGLAILDVKDQEYYSRAGFSDQHAGGQAFAHDEAIMGWLFGEH